MERHERLSAQVGLLRHPPPENNVSGGTVRELCVHEWIEEVLEEVSQDKVRRMGESGVQDFRSILILLVN